MQHHPSNNDAQKVVPGFQDPDVMSAIAAAAAEVEDPAEAAAIEEATTTSSPSENQDPGTTENGKDQERAASKTVFHDHRDQICEKEYDTMLNEAFDAREARQARNKKRFRIAMAACFLVTVGSAGGWYAASETNRQKVHDLWGGAVAITNDVKEGTDVVAIVDKYDAALDKIEDRQKTITDAAVELGVDPANDTAEGHAQLDKILG